MKNLKKFKEKPSKESQSESKKKDDSAPEDLYDADMDDLDSSDIGEQEKKQLKEKNTSKYDPGLQSNLNALRKGIYMLAFLVTLLFFCSSLFAFLTRRELIFPERSAPKYIFDMVQVFFFMIFVAIWVWTVQN